MPHVAAGAMGMCQVGKTGKAGKKGEHRGIISQHMVQTGAMCGATWKSRTADSFN